MLLTIPGRSLAQERKHVRVHEKEYRAYENFLVWQIKDSLSRAFWAGKLQCYRDWKLTNSIPFKEAIKMGQYISRDVQDPIEEDSILIDPFDYSSINQFQLFGNNNDNTQPLLITSIGIGYLTTYADTQKILYYFAMPDVANYLSDKQKNFLCNFYSENCNTHSPTIYVSLDSFSLVNYARKKITQLGYSILNSIKTGKIKVYLDDSLINMLTTPGDSFYTAYFDTLTGIDNFYYLTDNDDDVTYHKAGMAILYNPILNAIVLPEQPIYFIKRDDWLGYLNRTNTPSLTYATQFFEEVLFFELQDKNAWDNEFIRGLK